MDYKSTYTHQGIDEIQVHKEPYRETADAAKFWHDSKFAEVVDDRIDPTATLREQHSPRDWHRGPSDRIGLEFDLE